VGLCVNERDVRFVLYEMLGVDKLLEFDKFKDFDMDTIDMILTEAQKFSEEVLYEANFDGDKRGLEFKDGVVTTPDSYKDAYQKYLEGGWLGISADPELGGQGLPNVVGLAAMEFQVASSVAFTMYPGLTRAAIELLEFYGEDWMKEQILPKLVSGEWAATMCLTEPSAGSAVGDLKSTAKKDGDTWLVTGTKIFISCGEHDLTDQIIHLVLARTEGSPPGIKGISLFMVPKFLMDDDGNIGERNDMICGGIEHKMGIKASATCTLNFGDNGKCKGWLVGKECEGIKAMFVMMNEARIGTGMQGHSAGTAAYQHAQRYAKERVQGVEIQNMRDVNAPRVEIIKHPDVRRMLLTQKAYTEACRCILYFSAYCGDMALNNPDEEERAKYFDMLELLTPICKAWSSDRGFDVTREAMQTYGGYGYCSEYPVEQYMRDCKIMSIYEGTNGIQALDLVGRKVLNIKKQMAPYNNWLAKMREGAEKAKANEALSDLADDLLGTIDTLDGITKHFMGAGLKGDTTTPVMNASPYMMAFGDVVGASFLLWGAHIAQDKLDAGVDSETDKKFYAGKVASARFFIKNLLPNVEAVSKTCLSGDKSFVELEEDCFQ